MALNCFTLVEKNVVKRKLARKGYQTSDGSSGESSALSSIILVWLPIEMWIRRMSMMVLPFRKSLKEMQRKWSCFWTKVSWKKTGLQKTLRFANAANGTLAWLLKPSYLCWPWFAISRKSCIVLGSISRAGWLILWLYSTFWCNGMGSLSTKRVQFTFPSHDSASETSTIG